MPTLSSVPSASSRTPGASHRRRIGVVSTFPPQLCGLATFASALADSLQEAGHIVDRVCVDDGSGAGSGGSGFAAVLKNGVHASIGRVAGALSHCDAVIVQHEYGIYGGADGDEVLDLLSTLTVPTIVVLHTVPLVPTPHQREVLERVCAVADGVVVMSQAAHDRLLDLYTVDAHDVAVISHGATLAAPGTGADGDEVPELLTWGLIGPGKGIEHAIDAVAILHKSGVAARYTVAGVTHPKVFAARGDVYRHSLIRRAEDNGVSRSVVFDDSYRTVPELTRFVASATVIVLPYDSRDQVTSGVLIDAVAAGRPVIATAFPHAVEMLGSGAGVVVPHGDPDALADAIRTVLVDGDVCAGMAAEAQRLAPTLSWASVAAAYVHLSRRLTPQGARIAI